MLARSWNRGARDGRVNRKNSSGGENGVKLRPTEEKKKKKTRKGVE